MDTEIKTRNAMGRRSRQNEIMKPGVSINHITITVSNFDRSKRFYDMIFRALRLRRMFSAGKNSPWRRKIIGYGNEEYTFEIKEGKIKTRFNRRRVGLDHVAFTAPNKSGVDTFYRFLVKHKVSCTLPREYYYSKGYYAVFFKDPDGILLEFAYTP